MISMPHRLQCRIGEMGDGGGLVALREPRALGGGVGADTMYRVPANWGSDMAGWKMREARW